MRFAADVQDVARGIGLDKRIGAKFLHPGRSAAVIVGGLETLNLIGDQLGLTDGGGFWGAIGAINDNFGTLGFIIVGIFVFSWLISFLVYRAKGYDEIEVATSQGPAS